MSYHSSRKLLVHASPPPIFLPSDYSPPFISSTDDATSYGRNDYGYNMQSLHFNSSIALVMVVLVTAFFFLAFLSIYIRRCAFGHLGGFNNGGEPGQQVGNRQNHSVLGVDPELIATFPLIKYSIGDNGNEEEGESTLPVGQKEQQHTECAVCLSEFEDGETLRLLPTCKHKFHQDCIDMWLFSHTTCPLCRGSVVPSTSPSLNAQVDPEPSSMLLPLQPEATIARREGSLPREGITNDSWQLASLNSSELYLVVRRLNSPGDSMRFPKSSTPIPVATSSSTSAVSGVTQAAEENDNDDDDDGERRNTARKFRRSADFGLLEQRRSESLFSSSRWRSTGISLSRSFRLPRHGDGELLSSVFGRKSKEASTQQDSSAHQNVRHHNNVQGDWRHLQWIV